MATSREFQCPGCGHVLNMSDEMHMVAIMHQSGGSYMGFGSFDLRDSLECPSCTAPMRIEDVVAGRHKRRATARDWAVGLVAWAVLIGGIILLVRACS